MDALILNSKAYSSGAMIGWFDLAVSGLVITGSTTGTGKA
jgi:hypothetical protein